MINELIYECNYLLLVKCKFKYLKELILKENN